MIRHPRSTVALALLVVGTGLVLSGTYFIFDRPAAPILAGSESGSTAEFGAMAGPRLKLLIAWFLVALSLALIYLIGVWLMLRWGFRFRVTLAHRRREPTSVPDIWRMHRLPDE